MSDAMRALQDSLSNHIDKILTYFKPSAGAEVTIIIRCKNLEDGDVVFGNDDLDKVMAAIQRMKDREPTFSPTTK